MKIYSFFFILLLSFLAGFNCKNTSVSARPDNQSLQTRKDSDAGLIEAINNENTEKVRQLLESGANPDSTYKAAGTSQSITALGIAVDKKNLEIARLLLEKGANVDLRYVDSDYLNFRESVSNQDVKMAKLLADFHADTEKNDDSAPIIRDVKDTEMLDFLINLGFDINRQDIDGRTCLTEAIFAGDLQMVKAILQYKPDLSLKTKPLKVLNYKAMTALQIAKTYGNKNIIEELKKAGAK